MSDFEQAMKQMFGWNNCKDILENPDRYSEKVHSDVFYANVGWQAAIASMQGEAVAYIQHHKAGNNLVWDNPGGDYSELYTHAPDSAARIAEQGAEIARLQKELGEARKDALEEAAKIVDSWENAASIEGFNTDSISNEIRAAILQIGGAE